MAPRVAAMVTKGGMEGSTWCCISPTRPEVMLPAEPGDNTPSLDPVGGGGGREGRRKERGGRRGRGKGREMGGREGAERGGEGGGGRGGRWEMWRGRGGGRWEM